MLKLFQRFNRQPSWQPNLLICATHGGYNLAPPQSSEAIKVSFRGEEVSLSRAVTSIISETIAPHFQDQEGGKAPILRKNFSDFAVSYLMYGVPDENKAIANFSRMLGDPNRAPIAGNDLSPLYREKDFNGIPTLVRSFTKEEQLLLKKAYYDHYREEQINRRLMKMKELYDKVLLIDIHDTGNTMHAIDPEDIRSRGTKEGEKAFPEGINIGYRGGETCGSDILTFFIQELRRELKKTKYKSIPISLDEPYRAGDGTVTHTFGDPEEGIHALQVEIFRGFLMNEETQEIISENVKLLRTCIHNACNKTSAFMR